MENIDKDMFLVIKQGNTQEFLQRVQGGYNVHKCRWSGFQLIHIAASCGQTDICEILLEHGADINARTVRGWHTPLHLALANGYSQTATFLLHKGCQRWKRNKYHETAYEYGIRRGYRQICEEFQRIVERMELVESIDKHRHHTGAKSASDNKV
jgi:hypothetical protein